MSRRTVAALVLAGCLAGCQWRTPATAPAMTAAGPPGAARVGNALRVTDNLYSGSSPEGDEGFRSLCEWGVRTVISVDGAAPDVERARRFGLRYVHLPV